ncbi:MAG: hypothetical protein ACK5CW_18685 [Verrucomicrobiota bacterium]
MALVILAIAWAALGVAAGRDGFYGKKKTGNPAEPWVEVSRKPLVAAFGIGAALLATGALTARRLAGATASATTAANRQHLAELAARMRKLSVNLLPADIANPWKNLQSAWAQLADSPHPSPELIRTGSKAAAELNAALAARGFPDFHF